MSSSNPFSNNTNNNPTFYESSSLNEDPFAFGSSENLCSQVLHLFQEELTIEIVGYKTTNLRKLLFYFLCVISGGVYLLVCYWYPILWTKTTSIRCHLNKSEYVTIKDQFNQLSISYIKTDYLDDNDKETYEPSMIVNKVDSSIRLFDYRLLRFIMNPDTNTFEQLKLWNDIRLLDHEGLKLGLSNKESKKRMLLFGQNTIETKPKNLIVLFKDEILHPFYVFQMFSMLLWSLEEYYNFAICILIITMASIVFEIYDVNKNWKRIHEMSKYETTLLVLRNKKWLSISSKNIVPGDIIDLNNIKNEAPCDCVLIEGDIIVDESVLTGEAVPTFKKKLMDYSLLDKELGSKTKNLNFNMLKSHELNKSFVYMGTSIIRVKNSPITKNTMALVVRTGFNTFKGGLIRSIVFPKPHLFEFYRDSFRFIGVLSIIATVGFVLSIYMSIKQHASIRLIVLKSLDLITVVVPPSLSATMTVAISFALFRLRKEKIYCVSPNRINECGKINYLCFDKTGTLTQEGLDVLGVQEVIVNGNNNPTIDMSLLYTNIHEIAENVEKEDLHLLHLIASCHSLKIVENELVGDPLDIKMFEFSKCSIEENGHIYPLESRKTHLNNNNNSSIIISSNFKKIENFEFEIIKTFEFSPSLRRMCVVVYQKKSNETISFIKGAPETIIELCKKDSIPNNYEQNLNEYVNKGYRVIACAGKKIMTNTLTRKEVENESIFMGFLIFENKLKKETKKAISIAKNACLHVSMCTGDNLITAVSVAKECGIVDKNEKVYIPTLQNLSNVEIESKQIFWHEQSNSSNKLDSITLQPLSIQQTSNEYCLALSGDIYHEIINNYSENTRNTMLIKTKVFARMSPEEKQHVIESLQKIGYCVCFCGDGANDCAGLKAANVGVSLSDMEASAAAPFTSKTKNIECVFSLIKEGRAALVSSFGCFKYMGIYSIIQFTSILLLYSYASSLGDYQFLYIDLIVIIPLAFLMGRNKASETIDKKSPESKLVSTKVLTSFLGQSIIQIMFQLIIYLILINKEWFVPPSRKDDDDDNIENMVNTTIFFISSFQYIITSFVFCKGRPHRQKTLNNWMYLTTFIILSTFTTFILLVDIDKIIEIMQLFKMKWSFKITILMVSIINSVVTWSYENLAVAKISKIINRKSFRMKKRSQSTTFLLSDEVENYNGTKDPKKEV